MKNSFFFCVSFFIILFVEVAGELDIETPLFNNWAPNSPSASQGDCVYITVGVVSNKNGVL
jgi:hypothetical protein